MRSGIARRRLLARGRLRLAVLRWLAILAPWTFSRLAITSSQWESRAKGGRRTGEPQAQGVSVRQAP
jgi:hypothetical protein